MEKESEDTNRNKNIQGDIEKINENESIIEKNEDKKQCSKSNLLNENQNLVYTCHDCSYTTLSLMELKKHKIVYNHKKRNYTCFVCSYQAVHILYLKVHMMREHTQDNFLQCGYCGYKPLYKCQVKVHIMSHTDFKPFKCSYCSYKTRFIGKIKHHILKIHAKKNISPNFIKPEVGKNLYKFLVLAFIYSFLNVYIFMFI